MEDVGHVEPVNRTVTQEELGAASLVMLAIQGMGCRNCAIRVQNSLIQVKGVIDAEVYHLFGVAEVIYNPNLTTQAKLLEAVERAGGDGRHEYRAQIYG